MRRGIPVLLLPLILVLLLALACGGGQSESQPPAGAAGGTAVDRTTAGTISGRVVFSGTVPDAPPIDMSMDAKCASHGGDVRDRALLVVDGGLDNAFVYIKSGLAGYSFEAPGEPARLNQDGCVYMPRVLGVQAGQALEVSNSDPLLHNIHAAAKTNPQFNTAQPFEGMRSTHRFNQREIMVPFKCDVHPWMIAYVGVVEHPYFAVTNAGGRFELKDLPAGTYTVEAWHEKLGTQTAEVTIAPKETKEVELSFKAS